MPSIKKLKVNGIVYDVDASSDYENLDNLPSINNVILKGNKTTSDLGIEVPTKMTDLINDDNFVSDEDYVHTDNNYTTAEKNKLAELNNYDDTEIRAEIAGKQPAGNYLTEEADPTVANYIKAITQNDISNWNNKSDFSGSYNDASDKPSINGVELLGNKTAEQLGITGNICNLGLVSDYTRENPLDLNSLELGTYLLYKRYSSHSLNMKATYKEKEITGSYSQDDDGVTLLCLYKLVTDSLAERDIVGVIKSFNIRENSPAIRVRTISVQILSDSISASSGSYQLIEPVVLSRTQTITGLKTFTTLPKSSVVPSDNEHFTNKAYVDSAISTAISQITDGDEVSY